MVLDRIEQLICTFTSQKMGTRWSKCTFSAIFTVFDHDNVARLDRTTNFYMYLEKIWDRDFQENRVFVVFNVFLPFLSTTMLPDWTEKLLFTYISKNLGSRFSKKKSFFAVFNLFLPFCNANDPNRGRGTQKCFESFFMILHQICGKKFRPTPSLIGILDVS